MQRIKLKSIDDLREKEKETERKRDRNEDAETKIETDR